MRWGLLETAELDEEQMADSRYRLGSHLVRPHLRTVTVALVTTTIRELSSEVGVDAEASVGNVP